MNIGPSAAGSRRTEVCVAVFAAACMAGSWAFSASLYTPLVISTFVFGATAAVYLTINKPFLLALGFMAVSMFRLPEAFPFLLPFSLPLLLGILTCGSLLLNARSQLVNPFWNPQLKFLLAFFAVATVGIVFSINVKTSFEIWSSSFSKVVLITFAISWLPRTNSDLKLAARTIAICGSMVALVAIHNKFVGVGLVEGTRVTVGRDLGSVLGDPNDLAFVLLVPLSFSLALLTSRSGSLHLVIGCLCFPLMLLAIIYTQSRGGLMGVLAMAAVFGLRLARSKVVLGLAGIALASGLYVAMDIGDRQSGGSVERGLDQSAQGRLDQWAVALRAAATRPHVGVGLGNFERVSFAQTGKWMAVHSTWLGILAETGVPGFIAFIGLIGTTAVSGFRCLHALESSRGPPEPRAVTLALMGSLAGLSVGGSFLTHGYSWPFYVVVALTAALSRFVLHRADRQSSQPPAIKEP